MPQSNYHRVVRIASSIEEYWRLHPKNSDAVDGVMWWIPELALESRAFVHEALEYLVDVDVAVKKRREDGTITYSLKNMD